MDPIGKAPSQSIERAQQEQARIAVDKKELEKSQSSEEAAKAEKANPEGVGEVVNVEA